MYAVSLVQRLHNKLPPKEHATQLPESSGHDRRMLREGETAVAARLPGRPPAGCPSGPGAAESEACTAPPHCCTEITNKDGHSCVHQQLTLKIPNTGSHTVV